MLSWAFLNRHKALIFSELCRFLFCGGIIGGTLFFYSVGTAVGEMVRDGMNIGEVCSDPLERRNDHWRSSF